MTESSYDELILKLISNEITPEEKQQLMLWANEKPEHQRHLEEMKNVWNLTGAAEGKKDFKTAAEWGKFELLLDKDSGNKERKLQATTSPYNFPLIYKVAASLLLLFLVGIAFYQLGQPKLIVKESAGERINFSLPDGSSVWLNQYSQLEYPEKFSGSTRSVKLAGEAFFDVQKNPDHPFIIETNEANVQVLGTSFNVDAYPEGEIVAVTVQTGKVALASKTSEEESLILMPGTTGILNKRDQSLKKKDKPDENAIAWKTGKLQFDKSPLKEVFTVLKDHYNIEIDVKNLEILSCRFTSTFENATVHEVMETLSISLELSISQIGNVYTINGKGCK